MTVVSANILLLKYVREIWKENMNDININYQKYAIRTILLLSISLIICAFSTRYCYIHNFFRATKTTNRRICFTGIHVMELSRTYALFGNEFSYLHLSQQRNCSLL